MLEVLAQRKYFQNRRYERIAVYKRNQQIRVPQVRVITADGENVGVLSTQEAIKLALEKDLDLVLISENANPPVAKILDFNKFLYDERKKASSARAKSKKSELKEFVFGPTIDTGDLEVRISRAREFLKEGNRVRVTIKFKGREVAHPEVGFERIKKFIESLADIAKTEAQPRLSGNLLIVTFVKK